MNGPEAGLVLTPPLSAPPSERFFIRARCGGPLGGSAHPWRAAPRPPRRWRGA